MKACDIGYWMIVGPMATFAILGFGFLFSALVAGIYRQHGWKGILGLLAIVGWGGLALYLMSHCK